MSIFSQHRLRLLICLLAGALSPLGFAPFDWPIIMGLSLVLLVLCWQQAETSKRALVYGWLFGFAMFSIGIYWTYISIHTTSGAPKPLAIAAVFGLSAVLALFPAFTGFFARRFNVHQGNMAMICIPGIWVLFEWIKSWLLTGFPWLSIGYSQTETWLGGYAPIVGIYGVSWVLLSIATAVAFILMPTLSVHERMMDQLHKLPTNLRVQAAVRASLTLLIGLGLCQISWTEVEEGASAQRVALLQGNIPQAEKWKPEMRSPTLIRYHQMVVDQLKQNPDIKLIVLPEVALPGPKQAPDIDYVMRSLDRLAKERDTTLIIGANNALEVEGEIKTSNAVFVRGASQGEYNKRHLVPFGEYFPVPDFVRQWLKSMKLPFNDFAAGSREQAYPEINGRPVGMSICFEDVFGEELADALPEASVLINVTNDAWFGDSFARPQHLQIAQMRAKELGRYLLRATQNGTSAIISPQGELLQVGESFTSDQLATAMQQGSEKDFLKELPKTVLIGEYYPMVGSTPYVWWSNWPIAIFAIFIFIAAWLYNRSMYRLSQQLTRQSPDAE